jgi:hypothetical protein
MEAWLTGFRAGNGRPAWLGELTEPLERMVSGGDAAAAVAAANDANDNAVAIEAVAAAVPLAALGKDDKALPALQQAARGDAASRRSAAAALPWLLWEQRAVLFKDLVSKAGREELGTYVKSLSKMPSPLAAGVLWEALGAPAADIALANDVHSSLRQVYLGNRYYDRNSPGMDAKRQPLIQAAKTQLAEGTDMQRLVGMSLLVEQSPKDVIEPAERLVKERPAADPMKIDAFQALLLARHASSPREAEAAALAAVTGNDVPYEMKKIAIRYLCLSGDGLHQLRNTIWLSIMSTGEVVVHGANQQVVIHPPHGLTADMIRPMLKDEDKSNAACAGYLLCLLGERSGLDPLVAYWRNSMDDESMRRLVYRAVTALGDDGLAPILQEVYNSMKAQPYYARGLYQTIRSMKGANVAKLQKQMLEEVGKEQLQ